MPLTLETYISRRAAELGLNRSEICERAKVSRQTLYSLNEAPAKLPSLKTVVALAGALKVHPMHLLELLFDGRTAARRTERHLAGVDRSAFIRETVADGAMVFYGQKFTKSWVIHNLGNVPWEGRFLQCMDEKIVVYADTGELLQITETLRPTVGRILVPCTQPGATVELTAEFTAPRKPGTYLSYWKSVFADGSLCFPTVQGLSVKVQVSSLATAAIEGTV